MDTGSIELVLAFQDVTTDGCLGVLVCVVLSCFVCKLSFLLWYPGLFHQRRAHEQQGTNTRGFISYFSLVISGIIGHFGQWCSHLCTRSETLEERKTCRCAWSYPPVRISHTVSQLPGIFLSTVPQNGWTSATGDEKQKLFYIFRFMLQGDMAVWTDTRLRAAVGRLFRADRDSEFSGKTKGGIICFYINSGRCNDLTVIQQHCCPDLESFFINCSRVFASFILVSVQEAQHMFADQWTNTDSLNIVY